MTGAWAALVALLQRLLRNWPSKLVSLLAAFVVWALVTSASTSITQRSFLLPLQVEGIDEGAVAVGVPEVVEVSVSGPSSRIDRLRADQLRATIDLSDATQNFERQIQVQAPGEIRLLHVNPEGVIGFLEQVARHDITVEVALLGTAPAGTELTGAAQPQRVTVSGRSQVLSQVTRAVAVAPARGGEVELLALDARGQPVTGVTFEPSSVTVTFTSTSVLRTKEVPLVFSPPQTPDLISVSLSSETVTVAGSPAALEALTGVAGTVEPPTVENATGRYTLPVRLTLPSGVVAVSTPTATLQYAPGPLRR